MKNPACTVIAGFSSPHIFRHLRDSEKLIKHVIIIEPDLAVLKGCMERWFVGDILERDDVDLLIGIPPSEIVGHMYKIMTTIDKHGQSRAMSCQIPEVVHDPFAYPPLDGKLNPVVSEVHAYVTDSSKQVFLSMGCASDSFYRWEQLVLNEKNMESGYKVSGLFDKFDDMPVVVLGAGPSLKDFISVAKEYDIENRAIIIACDAALGLLLKENIRPHIVTRCERKLTGIFTGVKKEDTKDIFYAAYPWCAPEFFDLFQESFMLFRDNGVCKWSTLTPGSVNGGVSSANAALELAYMMGSKHVIMSGIDLCFLDGKTHIEGTEVEFSIEKSKPKWAAIKCNDGEERMSIPVWKRCLNEYAGTIMKYTSVAGNPHRTPYNTSLQGAKIPNTSVKSFTELSHLFKPLTQLPVSRIREKCLGKHTKEEIDKYKETKSESIKRLTGFRKELDKLLSDLEDTWLIAGREEDRVISEAKQTVHRYEFFGTVNSISKSLINVYKEPCRRIDEMRKMLLSDNLFCYSVADICQVDFFQSENKCNGLKNLVKEEFQRLKDYVVIQRHMLIMFGFYLNKVINLLNDGPDREVTFKTEGWDNDTRGKVFFNCTFGSGCTYCNDKYEV